MQDQPLQDPARLKPRRRLAFVMALLVSGVMFGPWMMSLYQQGSRIFIIFVALMWLAVGRFFYQLLAPASRERPEATRDDKAQ